ncbi:RabGAP/TBC [Microthyrium microscopicum]|uniref:RabGAP/TBC n=1 Tax=Microthyrium microscopicum TaxID=703497 RepID=A0A6A6TYT4_9PEZI|nr:RabGAP/TBC [Microthyrium microscopicum]
MKTLQQVSVSWNQYLGYRDVSSLNEALWRAETTPKFIEDLRSVYWKICLLFQATLDTSTCLPLLRDSRTAYASLRAHFLKAIDNPGVIDETGTDPLSEDEQSLWNALRADEIVREEIFRDVERCMPENDYFRDPRVQKLLLDILFVWCKLNPDVGYRQGMHEILAPLIWAIDLDSLEISDRTEGDGFLKETLDKRYLEHDAFTLFTRIMQTAKSFYEPAERKIDEGESPMIVRAKRIITTLLPAVDPELASHLQKIDILPQIFLMRWVRLLFGREFLFDDVLRIWDLLFSEGPSLELVDYVCIAMLLRIRWKLVQADTNSALTLLLRYPPLEDSSPHQSLVHDARLLYNATSVETGSSLILKYTGHSPTQMETTNTRPSTPLRPLSPFGSTSSPASLEALIQDAARGVLSRGERWGLNQAVRDVVGEVRRGVSKGMQNTAGLTANSRSGSPRAVLHRPRGSQTVSQTHSAITANILRKMNALEERNRKLADMLETTVADLWSYQDQISSTLKHSDPSSPNGQQLAERFSKSVAEVHFVQAFLRDMTLPLPEESVSNLTLQSATNETAPQSKRDSVIVAPEAQHVQGGESTISGILDQASLVDSPNLAPVTAESDAAMSTNDVVTEPITIPMKKSAEPSSSNLPTISAPPPLLPSPSSSHDPLLHRPRLAVSSFSWMLAENAADGEQAFARATPFAPNERRHHAKTGKGFLFGDDEDENGDASVQPRKSSPARKGSKVKPRGKDKSNPAIQREHISLLPVDHTEPKEGTDPQG